MESYIQYVCDITSDYAFFVNMEYNIQYVCNYIVR